jgi:hypothetical protein
MKIKLQGGQQASEADIVAFEEGLGCGLSDSFKAFVRSRNGAEVETNRFGVGTDNSSGVNRFIPLSQIPKARKHIENIPERAYPVAWAEGGNYVYVDEGRNGAVFFWDHELPDTPTQLACSFGAFLEVLEPFDIKSVQLKPGQVKSVWVDPEFLKKLKER